MKTRLLADAFQAGVKASIEQLPCDYRLHKCSNAIINNMIADERFTHDCVEEAIQEFKRGFQTNQKVQLC